MRQIKIKEMLIAFVCAFIHPFISPEPERENERTISRLKTCCSLEVGWVAFGRNWIRCRRISRCGRWFCSNVIFNLNDASLVFQPVREHIYNKLINPIIQDFGGMSIVTSDYGCEHGKRDRCWCLVVAVLGLEARFLVNRVAVFLQSETTRHLYAVFLNSHGWIVDWMSRLFNGFRVSISFCVWVEFIWKLG